MTGWVVSAFCLGLLSGRILRSRPDRRREIELLKKDVAWLESRIDYWRSYCDDLVAKLNERGHDDADWWKGQL